MSREFVFPKIRCVKCRGLQTSMLCLECRKIVHEAIEMSKKRNISVEKAMEIVDVAPANCAECNLCEIIDPFSSWCGSRKEVMRPDRFPSNQNLRFIVEDACPDARKVAKRKAADPERLVERTRNVKKMY